MRGVAYTMPSLPMKPMQRDSSTSIFLVNERPGWSEAFMGTIIQSRAMPYRLLFALLALAGCGESPPDPKLGAKLYAQHCGACHGMKLEGQPNWRQRLPNGRLPAPPHDESGHTWHHPPQVLFGITKFGLVPPFAPAGYQSDMPAFAGTL